jgi:sugar lactone lactonase YvrE
MAAMLAAGPAWSRLADTAQCWALGGCRRARQSITAAAVDGQSTRGLALPARVFDDVSGTAWERLNMTTSVRGWRAWPLLLGLWAGVMPDAHAACRNGTTSSLAMPAWTWLRSWRSDLQAPTRLAIDADGRVWIGDPAGGQLVARNADGSRAAVRRDLGRPGAIAASTQGSLLVGDDSRGRVTVFDRDGRPVFALGVGDGEFGRAGAIVVDPASGEFFVSDSARHRVTVYAPAGVPLRTIGSPAPADDSAAADGQLRTPTGLALAGNELLVADQLNYRVQAFDKTSGGFLYCIGSYRVSSFFPPNSGPTRTFGMAQGLWVDGLGRLYVADAFQGVVRVFDRSSGAPLGSIGSFGDGPGALRGPSDVLIDGHGRLFVTSTDLGRLDLFGIDSFTDPETMVPASAQVDPGRMDRTAPPDRVLAILEVPGVRVADVDPASLRVNGLLPLLRPNARDRNGNGAPELLLEVAGRALADTFGPGTSVDVTVSGRAGALAFTALARVEVTTPVTDSDGDGVPDAADACPGSPADEPVDGNGCTVAQSCPCAGPQGGGSWTRHGAYVSCISAAGRAIRARGVGDLSGLGAIVSQAATSSCGSKP